jgi:phosphate uptake regulator
MSKWLSNSNEPKGYAEIERRFLEMLEDGRHIFDAAANALLGGTDPETIRDDLFSTDGRINRTEQRLRRNIVVHGTVHGTQSFPALLVMMSLAKDAERIGDYAKNIFDPTTQAELLKKDPASRRDLVELKDRVSAGLASTRQVFDSQHEADARALARELALLEDHCDERVRDLLAQQGEHPCPATLVLAYRYLKRVISHSMNIATSIFMPLDKIDFMDEKPRPSVPKTGPA